MDYQLHFFFVASWAKPCKVTRVSGTGYPSPGLPIEQVLVVTQCLVA